MSDGKKDDEWPHGGPEEMIVKNLKEWRLEAGFTQEVVAVWIGISMATMQRLERGEAPVDVPLLSKLAALYGRDWQDALSEQQKPPDFSKVPVAKLLVHPKANVNDVERARLLRLAIGDIRPKKK